MVTLNRLNLQKLLLISAGAVMFNVIFWQEKMGVNVLLFDAFMLAALFYLYPGAYGQQPVRWLLAAQLICLTMIILDNTPLSMAAFIIILLILVSFIQYKHRSVWFAAGSMFLNFSLFIASLYDQSQGLIKKSLGIKFPVKLIRLLFFPCLLAFVFFLIYSSSNAVFSQISNSIVTKIEHFITMMLPDLSFARLFFFMVGFYAVGAILLKSRVDYFALKEAPYRDDFNRSKSGLRNQPASILKPIMLGIMGNYGNGTMALKNENNIGVISLLVLNMMLLFVNCLDILYIWLNFTYSADVKLSKMVHEGTGLLIVSILLAMFVLLVFFKGNLNFYKGNKWLKFGAYAWIFQNAVLVVSVFLRDYYYIYHYGLAYKRIAVLFFLAAVLTGLATVFIKILLRKTNYFLFRVNAWAAVCMLVISVTVNWDEKIAVYNISHRDTVPIDWPFLLSLSDKVLPIIDENKHLMESKAYGYIDKKPCPGCLAEMFAQRKQRFMENQQKYSWLSWNYADAYTRLYFENQGSAHAVK